MQQDLILFVALYYRLNWSCVRLSSLLFYLLNVIEIKL